MVSDVSDAELVERYGRAGTCAAVAREVGLCTQTVHERLRKLVDTSANRWTDDDDDVLRAEYLEYRDAGDLASLAEKMGRTKQFICRKARALGLTDLSRPAFWARIWHSMTEDDAAEWLEKFRVSPLGLGDFCREQQISDVCFWRTMTKHFPGAYDAIVESKAPLGSTYGAGRRFEYRTMADLKSRGFYVYRAPGSRSPVDVVGIRSGEMLLVQCRIGGALVPAAWNELLELAQSTGATAVKASQGESGEVLYMRLLLPKTPGTRAPEPGERFAPGEVPS